MHFPGMSSDLETIPIAIDCKTAGMENIPLTSPEINYLLSLIFMEGTNGDPYLFGVENEQRRINVRPFQFSIPGTPKTSGLSHE